MKRSNSYGNDLDFIYKKISIPICIIGAGRAGLFHINIFWFISI